MTLNCSYATKLANKATGHKISGLISVTYVFSSFACRTEVLHSNVLTTAQCDRIWSIYEDNMYDVSKNSSFGWDPAKKRKEMFHSLSRFILVYDEDTLLAFVMFRFEHEYDEDIIYCYEVQVVTSAQGKGLGKQLLTDLEKIGKKFNMEKIILTVLKLNSKARSLYRSLGYDVDPTSPGDEPDEDGGELQVDYEILSKVLNSVN